MNHHWPTDKALEVLHGPDRCSTCGGFGWTTTLDPLYPSQRIVVRCPRCVWDAECVEFGCHEEGGGP